MNASEPAALIWHAAWQIARRCPRSVDVRDLVQCGWVGWLEALTRYIPGPASESTYCLHRARGAMLDYLRGERVPPRAEVDPDELPGLRDAVSIGCLRLDLEDAMSGMSEREREAVWASVERGLARRLSAQWGVSEGRVSQMRSAACRKLRERLAGWGK